jgi:hypothetical protein
MGSYVSGMAGFVAVLAGGICIGMDRHGPDDSFPWLTLIGVSLVVAGQVLLLRARGLAAAEASAPTGPPPK